ncbi:hypothetical protein DFJ58DRAFT_734722, partial [Suillus subalutaceus]|uniref:uncharacterized protein n=1 Tax=Suillus subalutaceus TaxID=48586 RepID=UPI001B866E58
SNQRTTDHGDSDSDDVDFDVDNDDDDDIPAELLATITSPGHSRPITNHFAIAKLLQDREVGTVPMPLCSFSVGPLKFDVPDLRPAIADFLSREAAHGQDYVHTIGGARRAKPTASLPFEKLQVWFKLRLQDTDLHDISVVPAQTLNCSPPSGVWTCGRYDPVIVNDNARCSWPADGLHGHTVGEIRLILRPVGKAGTYWSWKDRFLTYVYRFDIIPQGGTLKWYSVGDVVPVTQLRAPVNLVPRFGASADNRLTQYNNSLVPLYNIETSTWNWDLPVNPPGGGSDSDTSGGSSHGAPASQDPEVAESATYEEIFASFMNALAGCLSASQPLLERECYATRTWSAANAHKALPGSEIKRKPDLVLSDDVTAKWGNIRPAMRLGKAPDTHAYLMMSEQPWRRFSLILSFTNAYRHLRVLLYDHSGGVVSTRMCRYDSTVSFTKLVSPPPPKIREYRPIKNIPRRSSSADPAASTSESLDELGSRDPSFDDDIKSVVSHDSDDDLESVVSDDSGSEERLTDSEDAPEGNSIESTMQTEEFPPSLPPVQPTTVSSAPLLSLASQIPQDLTESISSVTPHPSQFPYSAHSPEPCGKIRVGDDVYIIKRILSASRGLVGRGCICYLASLGDEDFIIKDHWVLGKREDVILNEIEMLKLMQGVPGVPELDYWLVTTSEGETSLEVIAKGNAGVPRAPVALMSALS